MKYIVLSLSPGVADRWRSPHRNGCLSLSEVVGLLESELSGAAAYPWPIRLCPPSLLLGFSDPRHWPRRPLSNLRDGHACWNLRRCNHLLRREGGGVTPSSVWKSLQGVYAESSMEARTQDILRNERIWKNGEDAITPERILGHGPPPHPGTSRSAVGASAVLVRSP